MNTKFQAPLLRYVKQSEVDWQVLRDGESYAWITNNGGTRMYTVTFRHLTGDYAGFRNLTSAKAFIEADQDLTGGCK